MPGVFEVLQINAEAQRTRSDAEFLCAETPLFSFLNKKFFHSAILSALSVSALKTEFNWPQKTVLQSSRRGLSFSHDTTLSQLRRTLDYFRSAGPG